MRWCKPSTLPRQICGRDREDRRCSLPRTHFHCDQCPRKIQISNATTRKRGIKEAIYIKTLKPSINIDPGRHTLSSHFDQILAKEIAKPPSPKPHDHELETLINTIPRRQGRPKKSSVASPSTQPPQSLTEPIITPMRMSQPNLPQRQSQRLLQRQQQQQTNAT